MQYKGGKEAYFLLFCFYCFCYLALLPYQSALEPADYSLKPLQTASSINPSLFNFRCSVFYLSNEGTVKMGTNKSLKIVVDGDFPPVSQCICGSSDAPVE